MYHPTHGSNSLQFVPITYFPLFCTITICLVLSPVEWPIRKDLGGFAAQCFQWSEGWQVATLLESGQYATVATLSAFYHLNITEEIENMTRIPASIHHHINILEWSPAYGCGAAKQHRKSLLICELCGFASKRNSNEVRIHFMFTLMHELFYIVLKHNFHLLTMNFSETNA